MCEDNLNNGPIDKMFCDNFEELARELENPSKKEKRLSVIQMILITVTVTAILTFYKYPEVNYWIKYITTMILIILTCYFSHKKGLESGLEMGRKVAKSKDELRKRMVDRVVEMIRERTKNEGDD